MDFVRSLSILLILMLFIPCASGAREDDLKYISDPGNIPLLENFTTPQMAPGDTGRLNFSIINRYDKEITQVNVILEIHRYANIYESKNISSIKRPPYFVNSHTQATYKVWNKIDPEEKKTDAVFHIHSSENTKEGTYFVRFTLSFIYNGSSFIMKSMGHFSKELWEDATTNTTEHDPGSINITKLGVDGIILDTTFGVKKPSSKWIVYVLAVITVMFAGLAILTYMYEENTNPGLTRWIKKQQRRLGGYRAMILHELKKFKKKKN